MTRMLHVEDQAPLRTLIRMSLGWEDIDVLEAVDGPSGVRAALEERPDAVLLGIHMRGLNGIEVARHLRDHPDSRAIPILFLAPRKEFCECVRELGLADITALEPPFDALGLAVSLEQLLESAQAHEPSTSDELQPLWALQRIAITADDAAVPELVGRWRAEWLS